MPLNLAPSTVEIARDRRIADMQAAYAQAVVVPQPFTTAAGLSGQFTADDGTVSKLQMMLSAFNKTQATPSGFYFKDSAGQRLTMSYADLQSLAETLGTYGHSQYVKMDDKIDAVNAAASATGATVADVLAVKWAG